MEFETQKLLKNSKQATKMGRPAKEGEKKDKKISSYLTQSEHSVFKTFALEKDISDSTLVRKAVLAYIENNS